MINITELSYEHDIGRRLLMPGVHKTNFSFWFIASMCVWLNISVLLSDFVIIHTLIYRLLLIVFYSSCLVPLLALALKNKLMLFSPIFLFNAHVLFQQGIWTQLLLSGDKPILHASLGTILPGLLEGLFLSTLGVLAFDAAYIYSINKLRKNIHIKFTWNYNRLNYMVWLMALIGIGSIIVFFHDINLTQYLHNINTSRVIGLIGKWGYISLAESALTLSAVCSLLLYAKNKNRYWLLLCMFFTFLGIGLGLLIGYRITSILILLVILFLYSYIIKRIDLNIKFLLFIFVLFIISSVYAQARLLTHTAFSLNSITETFDETLTSSRDFTRSLVSMAGRLQGSEVLSMTLQRTKAAGGYQWGWRMIVETPVLLLPRAWWPGNPFKKENAGDLFDRKLLGDMYYQDVNSAVGISGISTSWFGEMYWNFGFMGTILVTLGLGYFYGRIFSEQMFHTAIGPVLSAYLLMILPMAIEAPSDSLIILCVYMIPLYFVYIICRQSIKSQYEHSC